MSSEKSPSLDQEPSDNDTRTDGSNVSDSEDVATPEQSVEKKPSLKQEGEEAGTQQQRKACPGARVGVKRENQHSEDKEEKAAKKRARQLERLEKQLSYDYKGEPAIWRGKIG